MPSRKIVLIILCFFICILFSLSYPTFYALAASESQYTITVTARTGGKIIAPDGSEVAGPSTGIFTFYENSSAEFIFVPDSSKYLSDVVLDSFSLGPLTDGSYTFGSINGNHEIIGVFSDASVTIPESAGDDMIFTSKIPFSKSFKNMINKGVSFTSPVIASDNGGGTKNGGLIFMTLFRPKDNGRWEGNLKKYALANLERPECPGRSDSEWTIIDKNDDIAVDCDGNFIENSVSYWSDNNDGGAVDKGGVGKILLDLLVEIDESTSVAQYCSFRNIRTYLGSSKGELVSFDRDNITKDDLAVKDDATRDKVINFIYGYSYDADSDGRPAEKRDWVLGDIIHSEPAIIDYHNPETGDLQYRYVAVGANDGMLHVFTDTDIFFGGKQYFPGDEIFAFIPTDLLPELNAVASGSTPHVHMVDGSPNILCHDTIDGVSGYFHKTLVFGERRGGRNYWAIDISNPDPLTWSIKWHITGGSQPITTPVTKQINELGFTWNKPVFAQIKITEYQNKDIMLFAGGYDLPGEDGFPEAFLDSNNNGAWDPGEPHAATAGGTEGYDMYNPSADQMGRGIFAVDMDDGSLLFNASFNKDIEKSTGIAQTYNAMKYCFPADMSVIPFSESSLLIYAADIYGQIWKIKYDYYSDTEHLYESDLSTRWSVKRIFTANPGSDLASGTGEALVGAFTDTDSATPGYDNSDQGRKTFYSPDISFYGNKWTNRAVLYFGTGDRAHSRYTMLSNRFYAVEDTDSLIDETDLLNLTCNELDADADADNDGEADDQADDDSVRDELKSLFLKKMVNGFYRVLDGQGVCKDSLTDHRGEHILSQPTLFNSIIYFTSYQPVLSDPSSPVGNVFVYALDYSYGTSILNYGPHDKAEDEFDPKTLEDTFYKISNSTISSGVEIITKGGEPSGLIGSGGKAINVAEDPGLKLPGPPGGISQMIWEIE